MQPSTPSQDTKHKLTPPDPFTTYSRDEEDKEIKIAALTAKVKALQKQIAQRVRGFLMQSNGKGKKLTKTIQGGVQTDLSLLESNQESGYSSPTAYDLTYTPSHSDRATESDTKTGEFKVKIVDFDVDKSKKYTLNRQSAEQKKNSEGIQEVSQFESAQREGKSPNKQTVQREQFYRQERKKLMKQIKSLRQRVKFQSEVSAYAKEALLLSEEENYQFRLRLRALKEQLERYRSGQDSANHMLPSEKKEESTVVAQQDQLLQQKKKLQRQVDLLREEVNQKAKIISSLHHFFGQDGTLQSQLEKLKDTVFQISNCIPLKGEYDDRFLFRPESIADMILSLKRVQQHCSQISNWQNERHLQLATERQRVITLLESVAGSVGIAERRAVAGQIRKVSAYRCYLPIFEVDKSANFQKEDVQPQQMLVKTQ